MATVRFSQELKDDIIGNAKVLFSKRLQAYHDNPPAIGDEVADRVFKDFMPLVLQLPKQFFTWTEEIVVDSINGRTYGKKFRLSKAVPVPRNDITLPSVKMTAFYSVNLKLIGDEWNNIRTQIDAWIQNIATVEQERDAFVSGVKTIISTYSTLAPALKAWPPLWDLVPDAAKERHRKVVERAKPEVAEVEVDLTALTGIVTAAKFAK
jgi:hypothetical protein